MSAESASAGTGGCEAQVMSAVNAMELTPFLLTQWTEQRVTGKRAGCGREQGNRFLQCFRLNLGIGVGGWN